MIPPLNHSGLLPPYLGSPTASADMSPYKVTIDEAATQFATTPERKAIFHGLLDYRDAMRALGISNGIQWIDGSFVEDCESLRKRPPGDVDIVTLAHRPANMDVTAFHALAFANPTLFRRTESKRAYHCDAFFVDLDRPPLQVLGVVRYWFGLFTHTRVGDTWKGMLQVNLNCNDVAARALLV